MGLEFDFDRFRAVVCEAARARSKHPGEQFYAYALYTTGLFDWVYPACNTEEGLRRSAQKYLRQGLGSDVERQALELRWSPEDWAYQDEGKQAFAGVNRMLRGMGDKLTGLADKDFGRAVRKLTTCLLEVLQQLDREGIFGEPDARDGYVLNLLMDDQDNDSIVATARKVNPPKVVKRLKAELKAVEGWGPPK